MKGMQGRGVEWEERAAACSATRRKVLKWLTSALLVSRLVCVC